MSKKKQPVYQLPSEKKLNALLSRGRTTHKQSHDLSSDFSQTVSSAAEHHHLDRKAFNIIRGLDRMKNEPLARTWAHLMDYFVKGGLEERVDSVEELPLEAEDEKDGKVVPIREAAE